MDNRKVRNYSRQDDRTDERVRKIIEKNVKNKRRKRDDRMDELDEKNNGPTVENKI
jgi:hypothetical protein